MPVLLRLLLLSLVLGGCSSAPEYQVAPVTLPTLAQNAHKPSVHVVVQRFHGELNPRSQALIASFQTFDSQEGAQLMQRLMPFPLASPPAEQQRTEQMIHEVLVDSGLFEQVTMTAQPAKPGDYQLYLGVHEAWPLDGGDMLTGMATMVTLGLFPSSRPHELKLKLDVSGPGNRPLGRFDNHDTIDQRMGMINLFRLDQTQEKAERDTLKRQLDALLKQVLDRGLIPELAGATHASGD
ncbi:hypothetical protein [Pseudomonas sp. UFMG81]|jgi:hypothetical protein|uniref:hypothetical protein n=1 Tax=Pseudomonas sp. UFMG81 TaxID=2745936 RepID=UPI00189069B9|nr:hypothetical protein [Pseudomonas sp. UFMG81]